VKRPRPPVVTFLSDFGLADTYVAEMKGRVLSLCPGAVLVDLTHDVPPFDIEAGACLLARAVTVFPEGSIHLAVVDPGVGSDRRGLVIEGPRAWFIGPDNGLFTPVLEGARVFELDPARITTAPAAPTFHGRDLFAPAAARLAAGAEAAAIGTPVTDPVRLDAGDARGASTGRIVHVDRFGNCITSLAAARLADQAAGGVVLVALGHRIALFVRTYAEAPAGRAVALPGSGGRIEIAVREGSAAALLGLSRGDEVHLEPASRR
jgi:S-adenosyl-L-methionine hydrolase (adenosine-forming)